MNGKVALITGAGSGIGKATAQAFARAGATVIVADVDGMKADAVVAELRATGASAEAVSLDVSNEAQWTEALNHVKQTHGRLDALVNNAGISFAKPISEMTLSEWRRVLSVNLDGAFLGTKHAIHAMQGKGGSVVNVASASGITPYPGASAYAASKAALRLFSKIAAIECANAKNGVRVNVVTPAGVKTPMWETMPFFQDLVTKHGGSEEAFASITGGMPSRAFFTADEVARSILYLASDEASHLNGIEMVLARGHVG